MAFNPFHAFRKHQKAFFAGLTILCMVVFVLGGALGNFREFTSFFGGNQPRGNELVTLYGRPVTAPEFNELRVQREIANKYMTLALALTDEYVEQQVVEGLKNANLDQPAKDQLNQFLNERRLMGQFANQPGFGQQFQQILQRVNSIQRNLETQGKKNEAVLVQKVDTLLKLAPELYDLQRRGSPRLFFGGSLQADDLVDFLIWRHRADRLGIQFSRQDLRKVRNALVQAFTTEKLPDESMKRLVNILGQNYRTLTPEQLAAYLDNEFKVLLAKQTLLNHQGQSVPNLTPYELWSYFRDQRTENIIAMLPIPVAQKAFLDKVKEPTEEELKTFFDKHKDQLYNPASPDAGFKQPTRIQLEWVRTRPDSPIYQQATTAALDALRATLPVAYEALVAYDYNNVKWQFRSPTFVRDDFLLHDTSTQRATNAAAAVGQALASSGMQGPAALAGYMSFTGTAALHELSARLRAGTSILLSGSTNSPLSVLATTAAGFPATEYLPLARIRWAVEERMREDMHKELVGISIKNLEDELRRLSQLTAEEQYKNSLVPALLGHALASVSSSGLETLGQGVYERVQDLLVQRHFHRMALGATLAALGASVPLVNAQLAVRSKPSDWNFLDKSLVTADAQKVIAQAVAALPVLGASTVGLMSSPLGQGSLLATSALIPGRIKAIALDHGATQQPRDQYHIGEDAGLEPLREAFDRPWGVAHSSQTNAKMFAQDIFSKVGNSALFAPQRFTPPGTSDQQGEFLYWKTGERPAFVPTFAEVKDQVRLRWKTDKARALAKEAAEQIVAKLPKNTNGEDVKLALSDANPKVAGKLFELDHVAPLVTPTAAMPTMSAQQYQPYKVPAKDIEYTSPSGDLVKKLLKMKTEGEAIVVHDQPEDHYYVAVLVHRTAPYELTFFSDAKSPYDLLNWYERDHEVLRKAQASLVAQLRDQAGFKILDEKAYQKFGRSGSGRLGE